ncbi:sulfatase [Alienimonas sp. DA493]|uniref:sulfatase n=1 Tax=Alienimonas sp. DA493 TaxID=3373605 RepID=UPI003754D2D4
MTAARPIATLLLALAAVPSSAGDDRPNVLFIAIDDLRPELGCYGNELVHSPNLDALAADGMRFDRAYCQQAICSPSRASLMTGKLPDEIGVVENTAYFRELNPDVVTLPQQFKKHGYETVYSGKIYHGKMTDEEHSWSRPASRKGIPRPQTPGGYNVPENQRTFFKNRDEILAKYGRERSGGLIHGPAFEAGDVPDVAYVDGYNTAVAIQTLGELVEGDEPWFLGMGYVRPHLPFNCPRRYFDLYDPAEIELPDHVAPPTDGSALGLHASFELRTRHGIPKEGPIGDDLARELIHAYLACTSYVDAQIGRLLAALDEAGVRENTIVVVWGDHGWHLGEMGVWGKATNYEIATRVPLIVWTPPGLLEGATRGASTDALVELVDLYPTLYDLAGVPAPDGLAGRSLCPLLTEPQAEWKAVARSQFPSPALREWAANPLSAGMRETFFGPLIAEVEGRVAAQHGADWDRNLFENHLMGYATRTDHFRLVEWRDVRDPDADPVFIELYDHDADPAETTNVADCYPGGVARLSRRPAAD